MWSTSLPHPTSSYTGFLQCSPLPAYLTSYPVLHHPTPSYLIQPHPTLYPTAILTASYTGFFCKSAVYYLILPHPTSSTKHPTHLTPVMVWIVLPDPTTSNHILPCLTFVYPTLRCVLLPSHVDVVRCGRIR